MKNEKEIKYLLIEIFWNFKEKLLAAAIIIIIIIFIIIIIHSLWIFHTSFGWWSFIWIWVTTNFQDSPEYSSQS